MSAAFKVERGKADSDALDLAVESIWRGKVDLYTLRGSWEIDETNNRKTRDKWEIRGKYDRFSKAKASHFYGWQLAFESDEFADLDLRTITGPYLGRAFWVALRTAWPDWASRLVIVNPDNVARWHRVRFRRHWAKLSQRNHRPGGPRIEPEIRRLIRLMAEDEWGAPRIHGKLQKLGFDVFGDYVVTLHATPAGRL